jgi:hypothetical protein
MPRIRRLFFPALVLLLADRLVFLFLFGFQYAGSDDCIFWIGAKDYAHGIFHEPMIYGQNYGYMLEALLAVPGMWFHIPPQYLFPVISSLLGVAPFITFAFWFRKKNNNAAAIFLLLLPVFLSPYYGIQTTITRNFVCGLGAIALWPFTDGIKKPLLKWILQGAVLMFALAMNQTSIFAVIPLFIFSAAMNARDIRFWIGNFIGAIPVFLADHFAHRFYKLRPGFIMHHLPENALQFRWSNFTTAMSRLDLHFCGLCPLWWKNGSVLLLLLLIPAIIFMRRKQWIYFWTNILVVALVIVSLGFNKVQDAGPSVFFAYSRMYLMLPFVLGFFISLFINDFLPRTIIPVLLIVAVIFIGTKIFVLPAQAHYSAIHRFDEFAPVEELPVDSVQHDCARLYEQAKLVKADLIVGMNYDGFSMEQIWFDAGSVWYKDFPPNIIPDYERRTWRLCEEDTAVRKTILFIGGDDNWWADRMKEHPNIHIFASAVPMHLLEENNQPLIPLMESWGFRPRPFK